MTIRTLDLVRDLLVMDETPVRLIGRATFTLDVGLGDLHLSGLETFDHAVAPKMHADLLHQALRHAGTWAQVKLLALKEGRPPADCIDIAGAPVDLPWPVAEKPQTACFYAGHRWQQDAQELGRSSMSQRVRHYRCARYGCSATMAETLTEVDGGPRWVPTVTEAA